jgi:DNA end-binding protein Ku
MAKVIWKGQINFGLVNVPVRLYSASRKRKLDFRLVDKRDQNSVGYLKINKETGREVRPEEIARAIDVDGETVVLEDEDFEQAASKSARAIDIRHFVRLEQIEPAFFEKPYYLEPEEGAEKSYVLLREVVERTGRVGIAKVVLRKREHLAALMVQDDALMLNLLRFAPEIVDPAELDLPHDNAREIGVDTGSIEMATELVQRMTQDWEPEQYHDEYQEELEALIEQRARQQRTGEVPAEASRPAPEHEETPASDLSEQLRRSVDQRR